MASPEVQTVDPASFDKFREELDAAGFTSTDGGSTWTGPIAEPLRAFTDSERMRFHIRDGWPYLHPELEVPGMASVEHVDARGYVCLWPPGDASQAWRTLDGWRERIEQWCKQQESGFSDRDATMDAHAYLSLTRQDALATFDRTALEGKLDDGALGEAYGQWRRRQGLLEITTDREAGGNVRGVWFYRETVEAPPSTFSRIGELLTEKQAARLKRLDAEMRRDRKKLRQFMVLLWGSGETQNALVVLFHHAGDADIRAGVLEFAPSEPGVLRLRAGRAAEALAERSVVVFGAGSVGSQVALLLAESGLGSLTLVDNQRLRPGNVVRHAAHASFVGAPKVEAVEAVISDHAPWTVVKAIRESVWGPDRLRELLADQDLAVDATGSTGFADQMSLLAAREQVSVVTATLYRRGAVVRVQRQAPGDTSLLERDDTERYPAIPQGAEEEEVSLEAGCSAPVNRASPVAVTACASLAAEMVVDALGERALPDEITDVLSAVGDDAPFDQRGRITSA